MLKKLILHLWESRHQFVKYFAIGMSGVILDIGSLFLLKQYLGIRPVWAVVINQLFMLNYIFFLNKYWSFKAKGITHKQIVRFFILSCFNYAFSVGWMYVFNEKFGLNYLIARLVNIVFSVAWNFLLYKHWVYKDENTDTPVQQ